MKKDYAMFDVKDCEDTVITTVTVNYVKNRGNADIWYKVKETYKGKTVGVKGEMMIGVYKRGEFNNSVFNGP